MLQIWHPQIAFTTPCFLCNLQISEKARKLYYTRLVRLAIYKHSSLLCPFVNYAENKL
jgi:hypothetical protein